MNFLLEKLCVATLGGSKVVSIKKISLKDNPPELYFKFYASAFQDF
jgi:hypothetical protein